MNYCISPLLLDHAVDGLCVLAVLYLESTHPIHGWIHSYGINIISREFCSKLNYF